MKSLLITFDYPPDVGGMAQYYAALVKRANGEMEILHLPYKRMPLSWLSYFPTIFCRIKTFNELCVGNILPLGYLALILKFFCGTPYIVYTHGKDVFHHVSLWKRRWVRVILRNARTIYANSKYVRGELVKRCGIPRGKIIVLYPRVDVFGIEKDARFVEPISIHAPKGSKDAPFVLLSVGRLVERKGFDMVIRALSHMRNTRPPLAVSYWIIGEGQDEPRLRALAKTCNIENMVRFFGAVPRPELYGYYKACDCFIMPSRDIDGDVEGFGVVFLEAGVFGKPVVGGRSGGVPEAIEDGVTGLLVDPVNAADIGSAIERLILNFEQAKKMGEAGYSRVKEKFNLNKT